MTVATTNMPVPPLPEVEIRALALPEKARLLRIIDNPTMQAAGVMLTDIKALRAEISAIFDPTIKAAHNAHKTAVAMKNKVEAPLSEAETIIKSSMAAYYDVEEKRRAEAQRRIDEEAQRLAEDARIKSAEAAEAAGLHEVAERMIEAPLVVTPQKVAPIAKVEGVSFVERWRAEVTDIVALVTFAAANPLMILILVEVNQTSLNQMARAQKQEMKIPGVRAISEKSVAATSAKDPW